MPSPSQASQRPPLTLKEKRPAVIAARLGLGGGGKELADIGEYAGVGGGVGARGTPDGALADLDDLIQRLQPHNLLVLARAGLAPG